MQLNLQTAKSYCGAYTEDLRHVVQHVKASVHPDSPIIAVGYSLGANILVKYLGEGRSLLLLIFIFICFFLRYYLCIFINITEEDRTPLKAAVSVSNPFDFIGSMQILEKRPLYNSVLTAGCVRTFEIQQHVFKQREDIDHQLVKQVKCDQLMMSRIPRLTFGSLSSSAKNCMISIIIL